MLPLDHHNRAVNHVLLHIDSSHGISIYEQIVRPLKFAIANGGLQVGEHDFAIRETAGLAANYPKTVARP